MDESTSWAIATQQAHRLKKTPKNYGTVEGRKAARSKFKEPKKSYMQTADPKIKKASVLKKLDDFIMTRKGQAAILGTLGLSGAALVAGKRRHKTKEAEERSDMLIPTDMIKLGGFSDELLKIATAGRLGTAAKRGAELLAGGKRADPGKISRFAGKLKGTKVQGERTGGLANLKSKDPNLRREAQMTLATRAGAGTAGVVGAGQAVKGHRRTERKQLGRAYVAGARDMYGMSRRQQY